MHGISAASFFRLLSLFGILFQVRLLAGDLANTPVFALTLLLAAAAPYALAGRGVKKSLSLVTLALAPAAALLLVSLPRLFLGPEVTPALVAFDGLLLDTGRNMLIVILPYYWTAISTCLAIDASASGSGNRILRGAVIIDALLLALIFTLGDMNKIPAYKLPITGLVFFAVIVFFQFLSLLCSCETASGKREKAAAVLVFAIFASLAGLLLSRQAEKQAIEKGGGLFSPTLFSFDFAPYMKLEKEITMSEDLVFITHIEQSQKAHTLTRRMTLSGLSSEGAFFRDKDADGEAPLAAFPGTEAVKAQKDRNPVPQEYYLVNIDKNAFFALNEPVSYRQFSNYDAATFKAAFAVESLAANGDFEDLLAFSRALGRDWNAESLGMSEAEFAYYTKTAGNERIAALTKELTSDTSGFLNKIQKIYRYLKFGDFRYSLKPGEAIDGDQLSRFLFDTKKGYCSYFAFAFASLAREARIPCRVAVGFFIDPDSARLNFYPVRANMAHAWVEVWFGEYGWVELDPTTRKLAEGEDFSFSGPFPEETFERLIKEILEHKALSPPEEETGNDNHNRRFSATFLSRALAITLTVLITILAAVIFHWRWLLASRLTRSARKKTIYRWRQAAVRAKIPHNIRPSGPLEPLFDEAQRARFAQTFEAVKKLQFLNSKPRNVGFSEPAIPRNLHVS